MTADVGVVGVQNVLVVHEAMEEQLAYDITRVLFEKQSELARIHPEARHLSLATAVEGLSRAVPPGGRALLPGARRVETVTAGPLTIEDLAFESPTRELKGRSAVLGTVLAVGLSSMRSTGSSGSSSRRSTGSRFCCWR